MWFNFNKAKNVEEYQLLSSKIYFYTERVEWYDELANLFCSRSNYF